jgi:hypothetical protein
MFVPLVDGVVNQLIDALIPCDNTLPPKTGFLLLADESYLLSAEGGRFIMMEKNNA